MDHRMRPRRKASEPPLQIFDCRDGIPPSMQNTIDQERHVHGFDSERGFCLFGRHGTVALGQGPQSSGWHPDYREEWRPDGL